jgi:hypothetical protein
MDRKKLEKIIAETIGEASMLWSETPKGIFESDKASELVDRTVDLIMKL